MGNRRVVVWPLSSVQLVYDPVVCNPLGSSVHGNFQGGIVEWVPFVSPEDHPDLGIEPTSPASASTFFI